jgi:hypothetical protein
VVVEFLRPVDAEPDVELFRREEAAPLVVEQRAVGLDAVEYLAPRGPVLTLQFELPAAAGAFSRGHVLETTPPRPDTDRRVLARYPERDVLSSGYIEHEEARADSPAVVWVRKGKGQLALFAFSPQGRASTPATYKLLLNGLLLPPVQ